MANRVYELSNACIASKSGHLSVYSNFQLSAEETEKKKIKNEMIKCKM